MSNFYKGQPVQVRHVTGIDSSYWAEGYKFIRWEPDTGCAMLLITHGHLKGCEVRYGECDVREKG